MEDTDLSFKYSEVEADIKGHVVSIKNPKKGRTIVIMLLLSVMEKLLLEVVRKFNGTAFFVESLE